MTPAMVSRWGQVRRSWIGDGGSQELAGGNDSGDRLSTDMKLATLASVAARWTATKLNHGWSRQGSTTTFVPMYAQFHIQTESETAWRTHPPESGVPSWLTDCSL